MQMLLTSILSTPPFLASFGTKIIGLPWICNLRIMAWGKVQLLRNLMGLRSGSIETFLLRNRKVINPGKRHCSLSGIGSWLAGQAFGSVWLPAGVLFACAHHVRSTGLDFPSSWSRAGLIFEVRKVFDWSLLVAHRFPLSQSGFCFESLNLSNR